MAFLAVVICYGTFCRAQTAATHPTTKLIDAFEPGAVWLDIAGQPINCHGGGFLFHDGIYYWFGEFKVRYRGHIGVACYSSKDLLNWKNEGLMLSTVAGRDGDLVDGCVIERPKVIYNARTKKFVMWFHFEKRGAGYGTARAAVAVSDHATGPYSYLGSFRPNAGAWPIHYLPDQHQLAGPQDKNSPDRFLRRDIAGGQMSRDMTLFVDDDGSAYQIYAAEENQTLQISKLSDDYLKPAGQYVRLLVGQSNEAPAMFRRHGHYYLITSGTTGWAPNAGRLAVADAITGPWKKLGNPCVGAKADIDLTFRSQAAAVLPVAGKPDAFIYVGDRWFARNLPDSRYIFLPIQFDGDKMSIAWKDRWDLSVFDNVSSSSP
jgi:beta-xylosidase